MIAFFLAMVLMAALQPRSAGQDHPIDTGVSQALAQERASAIRDLRYDLTFSIPAAKSDPVRGRVVVQLTLQATVAPGTRLRTGATECPKCLD